MDTPMKRLIIDCHCDTIAKVAEGVLHLGDRSKISHIDLPRLDEAGVNMQFFALYIASNYKPLGALERTLELVDVFYWELAENYLAMEHILEFEDIHRILEKGKVAAFLTVEGGEGVQENLALLRTFFRLGVRGMTLTWNQRNAIADGAEESSDGGISNFGFEVVKEMNDLGMLIDVSHMNRQGFCDVVQASSVPVIASHSNARALCDHPRNLDDGQLKLLADNGGVVGITFVSDFLVPSGSDTKADINNVADHIDYIRKLIGTENIALGSDFDGTDAVPVGLEDVTKVPDLIQVLEARGYKESEIENICSGNVLRLLQEVLK